MNLKEGRNKGRYTVKAIKIEQNLERRPDQESSFMRRKLMATVEAAGNK